METWFDERFVAAAARDHRQGRPRMALTLAAAVFLAMATGWRPAVVWAACAVPLEAALQALIRPLAEGQAISPPRVLATAVLRMAQTYAWIAVGVLLWSYGGAAGQLCALMVFALLILRAVEVRDRSPALTVAVLPVVLAPLATALLFPAPVPSQPLFLLLAALMAGVAGSCLLGDLAAAASDEEPVRPIETRTPPTDEALSVEDLREAKAQAEAASQAKSAFLATMSHEIRTPLNGVLGMTLALAADPALTYAQRAKLQMIRRSGEALLAILNDALDLSKIEAGKLALESVEFDLEEIVREAHSVFKTLASQKGLEFRLSVEPAASGLCVGDPTRVRQVLFNVISNALKFTEAGEIGLRVERPSRREVRMTVTDTGVGIAADDMERIFHNFEQADASSTRRYGGTGLGLAICRQLCSLMGGSITAESEPGRGTRFFILLPLPARGRPTAAEPERPAAPPARPDFDGLRVLAAEDNPVNQLVLKALLAQVGIEPVVVENGALAVEAWRTSDFDLILMDIQMPQMDGVAATRAIRSEEARSGRPRTSIVALTANAMSHQSPEYLAAGMDAHIAKPLELGVLSATIERLRAQPPEAAPRPSVPRARGGA